MLNLLVGTALALVLLELTFNLINRWFSASIGESVIFDMRVALFDQIQHMPLAFFTRTQTGALVSRMQSDVVGAQSTVTTLATVVSETMVLVTTLVAMISISPRATLLALLLVPAVVVLDRRIGRRIIATSRKRMELNAKMNSSITERFNVGGALLVKLFGRTREEALLFGDRASDVRDSGVKSAMLNRAYNAVLTTVAGIGTAVVYWFGGRAVMQGATSIGSLVALALYVQRLYAPLTSIASARLDLLTALVSFERCFEVLDKKPAIAERPEAGKLQVQRGVLEFDHVWFRYPAPTTVSIRSLEANPEQPLGDDPSEWILEDIHLLAHPGTMTALVGPSGAGKSTLVSLVPRLYDVTHGSIKIDGQDIRDVTLQSLRQSIGIVPQDPHLFHDTIVANLRYANPNATDLEIVEACKAAQIHETIQSLPERYETVVGERGYRMSGGEKQRLAIARVFLVDPAIVILDEATAHLDTETELLVREACSRLFEGRTVMVIAHRLSTIRTADQILWLDNGRLSRIRDFKELLRKKGISAALESRQAIGQD